MEPKLTNILGSSLNVPNVQELSRQNLATLPPRYHRSDHDSPFQSNVSSTFQEIPVVDLQILLNNGDSLGPSELQKLHYACEEWGFFQLINHGVSASLMEKMKHEIQEFFKLPIEEKKRFEQQTGDLEGYGQAFVVSEEQKLDWADILYMVTLPVHLRKPHLIPNLPVTFRDTIDEYAAQLKSLAMKLLNLMAKALNIKHEDMETLFEYGMQGMRMNYYPPCPQPELAIGLCPHSDSTGLTILLDVNEVEGLQIKKDGIWIPVVPLPNAFIVNIGDILEIVTNGIYKSIEHRATVNSSKERISIATFLSPNLERDFGPAPSLITPQNLAKFKKIGTTEYFKGYFSRKLDGKSYVDAMRI